MDLRAWAWQEAFGPGAAAGQLVVRVTKGLREPEQRQKHEDTAQSGFLACKTSSKADSFPLCASQETKPFLVGFQQKHLNLTLNQTGRLGSLEERTNTEYKPMQMPMRTKEKKIDGRRE